MNAQTLPGDNGLQREGRISYGPLEADFSDELEHTGETQLAVLSGEVDSLRGRLDSPAGDGDLESLAALLRSFGQACQALAGLLAARAALDPRAGEGSETALQAALQASRRRAMQKARRITT